MDSFANTDVVYSDGQANKLTIPAEIQANGWKPPVRLPDGKLQLGDYLAANHLNFIFNDLYEKLSTALVVTEESGNSNAGYRKYSNGDIEMWGAGSPATGTGAAAIAFPVTLPAPTQDITITSLMRSDSTAALYQTHIIDGSFSVTGFNTISKTAPAAGGAVVFSTNKFLWRAYYHG